MSLNDGPGLLVFTLSRPSATLPASQQGSVRPAVSGQEGVMVNMMLGGVVGDEREDARKVGGIVHIGKIP